MNPNKDTKTNLSKPPYFGKLANENIQQIGGNLAVSTLCAFRKTCKFLADRTEPCFSEICFVEKHVFTTVASVRKLEALAHSDRASFPKTLVIHLAECKLIKIHTIAKILTQIFLALPSLEQVHFHIRGLSGLITDRKVDDMARTLADVAKVCSTTCPSMYVHHKVDSAGDPNIEPRSGLLVWDRSLGKYADDCITRILREFSLSLDTLSDTLFSYPRSWGSGSRICFQLNILNINHQ